jgi:hypothetical protein
MLHLIWFPLKSKFLNVLAPLYHDTEQLSLITRSQDYYKFTTVFKQLRYWNSDLYLMREYLR